MVLETICMSKLTSKISDLIRLARYSDAEKILKKVVKSKDCRTAVELIPLVAVNKELESYYRQLIRMLASKQMATPQVKKYLELFIAKHSSEFFDEVRFVFSENSVLPEVAIDCLAFYAFLTGSFDKVKSYFVKKHPNNFVVFQAIWQQYQAHFPDYCHHDQFFGAEQKKSLTYDTLNEQINLQKAESTFPDYLCELIIKIFQPQLQPSQIINPITMQKESHPVRTSSGIGFAELPLMFKYSLLESYIAEVLGIDFGRMEPPQILKYEVGEEYKPHYDHIPASSLEANGQPGNQRESTYIIYLNQDCKGGETQFPLINGLYVKGHKGDVFKFDNCYPDGALIRESQHASTPIEEGVKWVLVIWIRQKHWR